VKERRECIKEAVPDQPELEWLPGYYEFECIKEAVPDQPEPHAYHFRLVEECIKEAVPDQPEHRNFGPLIDESVSKRPFPTSQSVLVLGGCVHGECIKEAVPDQPERCVGYIAEPPECIKEAVPDQPERRRSWNCSLRGVYQRGRSRPARALWQAVLERWLSVSKRPFPTSQSPRAHIALQ